MATDRNGATINVGDDVVLVGPIRTALAGSKSTVVVGQTPHVCDDGDVILASTVLSTAALSAYLPLAGGTMTGAIDHGNFAAGNLADGALADDAATVGQVVTVLGSYLPLAGGTMTGPIYFADQWLNGGSLFLLRCTTGQYIIGDYSVATIVFLRSATTGKYGRFTAEPTNIKYDAVGTNYDLALQTSNGNILFYPDGAETVRYKTEGAGFNQTSPDCQIEVTGNPAATPDTTLGIALTNDTSATSGAQKYSPMLRYKGTGYGTGFSASQLCEWREYLVPVEGSDPTIDKVWESQLNGGGWVERMRWIGATEVLDIGSATTTSGIDAGVGFMGSWVGSVGFAVFAHQTVKGTAGSYALLQQSNGTTYLNGAAGTSLHFRINNVDIATLSAAGWSIPIETITGNTTLDASHEVVLCDATSGAFTATLPAAATYSGKRYVLKKIDSSANAITIDGNGAETIDDATTQTLSSRYDSVTLFCDGTEWWIT